MKNKTIKSRIHLELQLCLRQLPSRRTPRVSRRTAGQRVRQFVNESIRDFMQILNGNFRRDRIPREVLFREPVIFYERFHHNFPKWQSYEQNCVFWNKNCLNDNSSWTKWNRNFAFAFWIINRTSFDSKSGKLSKMYSTTMRKNKVLS